MRDRKEKRGEKEADRQAETLRHTDNRDSETNTFRERDIFISERERERVRERERERERECNEKHREKDIHV